MSNGKYVAAKAPAVTSAFWLITLLVAAMGAALADFVGGAESVGAAALCLAGLAAAMWWQLRDEPLRVPAYWLALSAAAVCGTICADVVHRELGLPYLASTALYALVLAGVLRAWLRSEEAPRRELLSWATVLVTFALGTAAGDLASSSMLLGPSSATLLFAAFILIPYGAWHAGHDAVVCFWSAYVLIAPLGASFADWFGAWGLADGLIAGLLVVAIAGIVVWTNRERDDVPVEVEEPVVERELEPLAG